MSKGYGICQRLIMNKLDTLPEFEYSPIVDLLPAYHKQKDYQALHRAARTLQRAGKLNISWANPYLVIHHVETEVKLIIDRTKIPPAYYKCILRDNSTRIDT